MVSLPKPLMSRFFLMTTSRRVSPSVTNTLLFTPDWFTKCTSTLEPEELRTHTHTEREINTLNSFHCTDVLGGDILTDKKKKKSKNRIVNNGLAWWVKYSVKVKYSFWAGTRGIFYFFSMCFKEGESAVFWTNLTLDCTRMLISFNHSMCLQSLNRAKEGSYDCSVRH